MVGRTLVPGELARQPIRDIAPRCECCPPIIGGRPFTVLVRGNPDGSLAPAVRPDRLAGGNSGLIPVPRSQALSGTWCPLRGQSGAHRNRLPIRSERPKSPVFSGLLLRGVKTREKA